MARKIPTIQQEIIDNVQSDATLYDPTNTTPSKRGLTSTSAVAIWRLWTFIVATAIGAFEQLLDIYQSTIEAKMIEAPAGTNAWLRSRVLLFQYDAVTPQYIQFNNTNYSFYYDVPNTALCIVTSCAVITNPNKVVLVKVAKGGSTPVPLSSLEKAALTTYLDYINFAGVYFELISADADFIMVGADIYYDGQFASVIVQNVKDAINNYVQNLPFNGLIVLSKLEDAIQSVQGVNDVVFSNVEARPNATIPANAFKLVSAYDVLLRNYSTFAGYSITDTATGRTLDDTLNFVVS